MEEHKRHRVIDQEEFSNKEEIKKGIKKLVQLVKYENEPARIRICVWTQRTNHDGTKSFVYSPWPPTFLPEEGIQLLESIEKVIERYRYYMEIAESEQTGQRVIQTRAIFQPFTERESKK